jgi:o-succinylbenzoate---CoA ligase
VSQGRPPKPRGPQAELEFSAACSSARRQEVEDVVAWWNSGFATYTLHTSGSTGAPKELMLQRKHIEASALATIAFFGLSEGQRSPLLLSAKTVGGLMMVVRALMAGLKLDILPVERRPATRPGLRYDFVAMVPEQAAALAADPQFDPTDFHCTLLGGADVRPELEDALSKWPRPVYHGYGMTETLSHVALRQLGQGRTYQGLPGVLFAQKGDALVVDDPSRGVRELVTTDAAKVLSNSEFEWLGRLDGVVVSAGKKIFPEVVEAASGREGVAVGIPSREWGQMLVWVGAPGFDPNQIALKWEALPSWQRPKHVLEHVIPYKSSGKPDRQALAQWAAQELALR